MIFDDKCDASVGSDIVVSAMAEKDTYVAIGGMGDFGSEDGLSCVRHKSHIQKHDVHTQTYI